MLVGAVIAALIIFSLFLQLVAASPKPDTEAPVLSNGNQDVAK